jgi:hypothetical protein
MTSHETLKKLSWVGGAGAFAAAGVLMAGSMLPATAADAPSLGAARKFGVLGASTVSSTGLTTVVGDVGVSPGTAITGFPPGVVVGGEIHAGDAAATAAHADAALAYDFLAGMASIPANNLTGTDLGGLTLAPAVYKFNTSAQLTGTLTLDAQGQSDAIFVFQVGSTLTTSSGAAVVVINGGADFDDSNVFWQVGSSATVGTGTSFVGNIVAYASITLATGSSLSGNALAIVGAVSLDSNALVTSPPVVIPPPPPGAPTAPSELTATPIQVDACVGSELRWIDRSDNETEFRIYRRDGAGPAFVRIGSVVSTTVAATGGALTFRDPLLGSETASTYRVTAFKGPDLESLASNDFRVDGCAIVPMPNRWLDCRLGRGRGVIMDRTKVRSDSVLLQGSYTVFEVTDDGPVVLHDLDPRVRTVSIQVRAPGNLFLVTIPANDPRWKVTKPGIYRWTSAKDKDAPASVVTIDTRKSEFTLKAKKIEFGAVPVNAITVTLGTQGVTGSDVRAWIVPAKRPAGTKSLFTLPK